MNLPWGVSSQCQSLFGQVSAVMAPAFAPAGFDTWQASCALVSGSIAKEVVVTTMAQAYVGEEPAGTGASAGSGAPVPSVAEDVAEIGTTFLAASDGALRSTLSIIPGVDLVAEADTTTQDTALSGALGQAFTPLAALAFLVFVLIYTPCVATLSAIKSEFGWRWAGFSAVYQAGLAWLLAVIVFQAGSFLGLG
jgi:ferrous iron transport protein B